MSKSKSKSKNKTCKIESLEGMVKTMYSNKITSLQIKENSRNKSFVLKGNGIKNIFPAQVKIEDLSPFLGPYTPSVGEDSRKENISLSNCDIRYKIVSSISEATKDRIFIISEAA